MDVFAEDKKPEVMCTGNFIRALVVHILFFVLCWTFGKINFRPKETVIPIDLVVVVNENLDGKEDEPPPLEQTPPEPPKPPEQPKPTPPPPTPPKVDKVEAVEKVVEKKPVKVKKPPEKKVPEKKPEPPKKNPPEKKPPEKKPEPPKKSEKELREERLAEMRKSATRAKTPIVVKNKPSGDGKTAKKTLSDDEVRKLLGQGYKPGKVESIAPNELSRCVSCIQSALNAKWEQMSPRIGREGTVFLTVRFDANGRMINVRLNRSCGDAVSDNAALSVARSVGYVAGLTPDFIRRYSHEDITIRYKVTGR